MTTRKEMAAQLRKEAEEVQTVKVELLAQMERAKSSYESLCDRHAVACLRWSNLMGETWRGQIFTRYWT